MIVYCQNDPCESEAVYIASYQFGHIPLCSTCERAFDLGRAMTQAVVKPISAYGESELKEILGDEEWEEDEDG